MSIIMKSKTIVNIKKLISVLICTVLISATLPSNLLNSVVFAADKSVSNSDELKNAVNNANNGDIITLTSDITIPDNDTATDSSILNCSKNITIKSASGQKHTINFKKLHTALLSITGGCTVNLENIIINGSDDKISEASAIKVSNGSKLNITGTTLQNFYISSVIYCENSNVTIDKDSTISNCQAVKGGAIYATNSEINMNGTISNCTTNTDNEGGAIYCSNSTLTLNGNIRNCKSYLGGAIYCSNSTLTLNGNISDCKAYGKGGAILADSGSVITLNGNIKNCSASGYGGAIYMNGAKLTMNGGNISDCYSSQGGGGAISCLKSQLQIYRGSISGCYSLFGNAICIEEDSNLSISAPNTGLFSISLPKNADSGLDNGQIKYGYPGINDLNIKDKNNTVSGAFEAEDQATGIQVSAPEGVIPPWCTLVVSEKPQVSDEYDKMSEEHNQIYDKLDSEKKAIVESYKIYEIHLKDQDGNIIQPDTSKGLVTVRIPISNDYDLAELEVYRINEGSDDKFNGQVVKINNKSYYEYKTDHFSPYILIDKNTMNDITQALFYYSVIILPLLLLALIIIILKKRSHR